MMKTYGPPRAAVRLPSSLAILVENSHNENDLVGKDS